MAKSSTASFSSCQRQCSEIINAAAQQQFAPVYLLHGAEGYFIDRVESAILANAIPESEQDFNQTIIYGKESTGGEVVAAARRYPMFGGKQLVLVREAQILRGLADVAAYLEQPLQSTILVISHRDKAVDKRGAFYKKFSSLSAKGAVLFESVSPREWEVLQFVQGLLQEKGIQMTPEAQQMIADNVGVDLIRISHELDKLSVRLGAAVSSRVLDKEDVEANIGISRQFNNFELTKALSSRRFDLALKIASHLSANSKDNPFVLTISALFNHFQRITTLGFLYYDCRQSGKQVPSDGELAKLVKIPNVYFLDEYKMAARNYSLAQCVQVLSLVREFDLKSKGIGGGSVSEGELLRDLLLRISLL